MTTFTDRRRAMVRNQVELRGIRDPGVLVAMRAVPREFFVPDESRELAYEDSPLPIQEGQTISQPYIVARMTEALLAGRTPANVLEVGTGCGYQTAVLAGLVGKVHTIERIEPLLTRAKGRLKELGIKNVKCRLGDGFEGWKTHAPYDAILVAAAPMTVPEALLAQLAVGGRLIVPVGGEGRQELLRLTKGEQGVERKLLGTVSFVPLQSGVVSASGTSAGTSGSGK